MVSSDLALEETVVSALNHRALRILIILLLKKDRLIDNGDTVGLAWPWAAWRGTQTGGREWRIDAKNRGQDKKDTLPSGGGLRAATSRVVLETRAARKWGQANIQGISARSPSPAPVGSI